MALTGRESRASSPTMGERRSGGMPLSSSFFSLHAEAEKPLPTLLETMRQRSCSYSSSAWRRRSVCVSVRSVSCSRSMGV